MPARRRAGRLALLGVATGALAAAIAAGANAGHCSDDPGGVCRGLVRMLSLRVGLVTGVFAVLLALTALGLARMTAEDERRRRLEAAGALAEEPAAATAFGDRTV